MPKDAKKNVDRYKIRGGDLNEFEFSQNQALVKESFPGTDKSVPPMKASPARGTTPKEAMAQKSATKTMAKKSAKKTTGKKSTNTGKKSTKKSAKKATTKKSAKGKPASKK